MKLLEWLVVATVIGLALVCIAFANYITPQDKLEKADVIVAVSGGDTYARTMEAVRLYQDKWAPRLIFSGAAQDREGPSNAAAMKQIAIAEGVPSEVITVDENSLNTVQNADEVAYILEVFGHDKIILVTSPYHQQRTYLEFKHRLGDSIKIINHSAPDEVWQKQGWWRTPKGWYLTFSEGLKTLITAVRY